MTSSLSDMIDGRRDALITLTQDLIRFPTLNPPGADYRAICEYLAARLRKRQQTAANGCKRHET